MARRTPHAGADADVVAARLARERGTLRRDATHRVALVYPSPYHVAMSSLGFLTIYREINAHADTVAERAFLPDDMRAARRVRSPLLTYESRRPVGDHPVLALSVAYELELAGVVEVLELAGLHPLAAERSERDPFVLGGGPLTFSNPLPLAPFADAILLGEADETVHRALDILARGLDRRAAAHALAREVPGAYVPALHGETLPEPACCSDERLPAFSPIATPDTELSDMFLVEAVRGCSRRCAYCVMRRKADGGMRRIPLARLLEVIPAAAHRVGLVGAGVSDHPEIVTLLERLADRGCEVGLSSLRPDRLNERFVTALRRVGYRTLTTAADGASQRLRDAIDRGTREEHLVRAAELARQAGLERLKLYVMVGLPGETDDDIDELIDLTRRLSAIVPLALGIAPFVAKRHTLLDGQPFAGIATVEARLARLRRALAGRVDLRATSARWAWVEHRLAQGGWAEGHAALDAVHAGGRFADWKRALESVHRGTAD